MQEDFWKTYEPNDGDKFRIPAGNIIAFDSDFWNAKEVNEDRIVTVNIKDRNRSLVSEKPLQVIDVTESYHFKKHEESGKDPVYYMYIGPDVSNINNVLKKLGAIQLPKGGARNRNKNTKTYRRKKRSTSRRNRSRTRS